MDRLVRVLDYVLRQNYAGAPLSQIAESVSGPLSSTHDLLRSMVNAGLLVIDDRKLYRAGPVFVRLAVAAIEQVDLVNAARPHLKRLVQSIEHDAYLAVRVGNTVTYVERVPGLHRAGLDIRLGDPVPLHSSAVGKLFAAYDPELEKVATSSDLVAFTPNTITTKSALRSELEAIRERGFAMSMEETISGIIGFAAPVHDRNGVLIAAVHVSAFKDYLANADIPEITRQAKHCSGAIQELLTRTSAPEE
ncbi:IclR family transcriptional regulator [Streptosporangium sp. NBC_01755]|uniref:IclR family transcriptional regulator n=1 Tax=unclassified Streptosporangium TaxID=2632669 RepID=UPI002DDAFF62|nr:MULTISPECIES: IclR family transcriptional regulator [unclassified Streptosporangium]WSA28203.1 IclR family transcriptional regulator [Streptosporangium sp. NBC_01810]WSD00320.1 IclR family transcriptional regulator [Streptosporangium sp. NBC_01755]